MILNHCHVGPTGYFQKLMGKNGEWDDGSLKKLAGVLPQIGYDRAVVFAPFQLWFEGDPNAWLLEHVKGDPRFVPWVCINQAEGAAEMLAKAIQAGAKGIKFHPPIIELAPDDPRLDAFYGLAESRSLPILYHAGPHGWDLDRYRPSRLGKVAAKFPKLAIICEHLGGAEFCEETWQVMEKHEKVMGGLASCLPQDATWHVPNAALKAALKRFGPSRFVFGMDFPYNSLDYTRTCLQVLDDLIPSPEDRRLVLSGNLEGLLEDAGNKA
jgi:predicted TIM-barrel fold metal-dependent hydrolase